jgi:Raf kinase inhibitor-like YbhB/YbcL family protein
MADSKAPATRQLLVTSSAFPGSGPIPEKYSCNGAGINPPLDIKGIPPGAASLALIMYDPDAPVAAWAHWLVWNIPVCHHIKENYIPVVQGMNDFGRTSYNSPCQNKGSHRYHFHIYALDCLLSLLPGASRDELERAMEGHIMASGGLTGYYTQKKSIPMFAEDLIKIQDAKDAPCVTIITTRQTVEKAIRAAAGILHEMYPAETEKLLAALYELAAILEAEQHPALQGAGLYVSPALKKILKFPFPVKEKMVIGDMFCIRELYQLDQYMEDYRVLHINGKSVQYYKGCLNKLEEIRNISFPRRFQNEYEYSRPSRSSSYAGNAGEKSFEKDKSVIQAERLQQFYREADKALTDDLGELPLVIAGPKKNIALLESVSRHCKNIIGHVNGNYSHVILKELTERVWPLVRSWIDKKAHGAIPEFIVKTGSQLAVEGAKDVWEAASQGRGYKLLVEKDYTLPGFVDNRTGRLYLKPPRAPHHIVTDVTGEIMRTVRQKKGVVVFVDNNALDIHQHIALITRY